MSEAILIDKSNQPMQNDLKENLKETFSIYNNLQNYVENTYKNVHFEWKYYGKKNGWLQKCIISGKNLFFVMPAKGYFTVSFTL